MFDPYQILGVDPKADLATIKAAWKRLAMRAHPDRPGGNAERMSEINMAWALVSDPVMRERFDLSGNVGIKPPIDVKARQALMQMILFGLLEDFEVDNIREWVVRNLEHNLGEHKAKVAKNKKMADKTRRTRDKVKVTAAGEILIGGIFDHVINGYDERAAEAQSTVDALTRAREMVDELIEDVRKEVTGQSNFSESKNNGSPRLGGRHNESAFPRTIGEPKE